MVQGNNSATRRWHFRKAILWRKTTFSSKLLPFKVWGKISLCSVAFFWCKVISPLQHCHFMALGNNSPCIVTMVLCKATISPQVMSFNGARQLPPPQAVAILWYKATFSPEALPFYCTRQHFSLQCCHFTAWGQDFAPSKVILQHKATFPPKQHHFRAQATFPPPSNTIQWCETGTSFYVARPTVHPKQGHSLVQGNVSLQAKPFYCNNPPCSNSFPEVQFLAALCLLPLSLAFVDYFIEIFERTLLNAWWATELAHTGTGDSSSWNLNSYVTC